MAGTLTICLNQQFDQNGAPLAGGILYIYQAGTVSTLQNAYQDFGLSTPMPNPMTLPADGRIPMFWLADGLVHARLTDSYGVVRFDTTMQTIGPSSGGGGGGGGGGVDPTSVLTTGDFKWRPTSETLTGWVKSNAQTIGSPTSGASERANNDTQSLFVYLWNNFTNAKCPVSGGRGSSGNADFAANKTIQLPDLRGVTPVGLDDMGSSARGLILSGNVTSGGGDGPTTPAAGGGESNHLLLKAEIPKGLQTLTDPGHYHSIPNANQTLAGGPSNINTPVSVGANLTPTNPAYSGVSLTDNAGGGSHNNMQPFMLGTWYCKL